MKNPRPPMKNFHRHNSHGHHGSNAANWRNTHTHMGGPYLYNMTMSGLYLYNMSGLYLYNMSDLYLYNMSGLYLYNMSGLYLYNMSGLFLSAVHDVRAVDLQHPVVGLQPSVTCCQRARDLHTSSHARSTHVKWGLLLVVDDHPQHLEDVILSCQLHPNAHTHVEDFVILSCQLLPSQRKHTHGRSVSTRYVVSSTCS